MSELDSFLRYVQIAHHIPGRIRLKLVGLKLDAGGKALLEQARQFQQVLEQTAGVKSIRLNLLAGSCVVEYDKTVIPPSAWTDTVNGESSAAAAVLQGIIENGVRTLLRS